MSSKNTSESMIAERRLRPIYDLLDYNNNKKAIQEADRVLKKSPDLDCAKVLKSLALLRLGRDLESEQLLDSVAKRAPTDDATLQAMTICYRELRTPEKICSIFEEAAKKEPTNEEVLTHLFMSYVRVYNYKKQQHTAMSLYKLKQKNPYYFWAVMSIVMQASKSEDGISKSVSLPLAERMVKKFIDENKIDAEQEIQLYVIILEMQNKHQDILDLLASPTGKILQSYYTALQKKTEILMLMKQWDQVNLVLKQQLLESDSWQLYLAYLDSVFHLVRNRTTPSADESFDDVTSRMDTSFEMCAQFLRSLAERKAELSHRSRGVHLVKLEFHVKLREYEKEKGTEGTDAPLADRILGASLIDLLLSYYKIFGATPCCLKDLQPYLSHLSPGEVGVVSGALWRMNEIVGEEEYEPTDKTSMMRFMSCLQFNRYLGKYNNYGLPVDRKLSLILRLTRTYYICDAYTKDQAPAELKHNDAIVHLILHLLHDMYVSDEKYMFYILLYIHYVSNRNHYNFNLELLALTYYHIIGASGAGHMCYDNLDLKHIQLDSLGYLHLGPLLNMAQFTLAAKVFDSTLKFFTINYKDNADHLVLSYKFGSFIKIDEFHRFRARLNNSLHYTLSTIEKMLLDILHLTTYREVLSTIATMSIEPGTDNIIWSELEDNRDLSVFNSCNPSHMKPDATTQSVTHAHDVTHLRLRALVLRILVAGIQLAPPTSIPSLSVEGKEEERVEVLRRLIEEMAAIVEGLKENPPVPIAKDIQGAPPPSRLFFYLSYSFLSHFLSMSRAVLALASQAEGPGFESHMVQAVLLLKKDFEEVQARYEEVERRGAWRDHRDLIQIMNLFVEMIAITNIKCGAMTSILKQNKARGKSREGGAKKKKKHKKSEPSELIAAGDSKPKGEGKDPAPILQNVIGITKELSGQIIALTNKCESILQDNFMTKHSMESFLGSSPAEDALLQFLLSHPEDTPPPTHNELAAKVENLRLVDARNDSEKLNHSEGKANHLKSSESKSNDSRMKANDSRMNANDSKTKSNDSRMKANDSKTKSNDSKTKSNDSKAKSKNTGSSENSRRTSETSNSEMETVSKSETNSSPGQLSLDGGPPAENHCSGSCEHRRKLSWRECSLKVSENVMNSYQVSYSKLRLVNLFKSFTFE